MNSPDTPVLKALRIQNSDELMELNQRQEENIELLREKDSLLYFNNAISFVNNKDGFQHKLCNVLSEIFGGNGMMVILFDRLHVIEKLHMFQIDLENKPADRLTIIEEHGVSLSADSIVTKITNGGEPLVWSISELMKLNNRPTFITQFRNKYKIKTIAGVPWNHSEIKGILFLFFDIPKVLGQKDLKILKTISEPIFLALQNVLEYEKAEKKNKQQAFLLELIKKLLEIRNITQLGSVLQNEFKNINSLPGTIVFLSKLEDQKLTCKLIQQRVEIAPHQDFQEPVNHILKDHDSFLHLIKQLKSTQVLPVVDLLSSSPGSVYLSELLISGIRSITIAPFNHKSDFTGALLMLSKNEKDFIEEIGLLDGVASQLDCIISNLRANELVSEQLQEVKRYQDKLEVENLYLQEEIQTTHNYSEIVGTSRQMKEVYNLVAQVAFTNSSVLILGETGTGKELIARAIHNSSNRKDHVMVKVNCAVLPPNLIESELFGHEKGSFTDATDRRIGKFEMANNSTIFLDEIGELSFMLQAKLLRALQEKEIERVGGKLTIKTDVRVIAATNKDLLKEVQAGNFRSDLYFRLNVFPILIPSLRERKEDIPLLANYFAEKYSKKIITKITRFTSKAMKQLIAYNWPGNVRELEHLVERSVLMTKGSIISQVYLPGVDGDDNEQLLRNTDVKTIDEVERAHILAVLKMVNGKVSGVGGAAEILKIPATTLSSKILRLKITKGIS